MLLLLLLFCITCADRHARRSGVRPKALNSRTLCCVGLVFYKNGKKKNNFRFRVPATICHDKILEKYNLFFPSCMNRRCDRQKPSLPLEEELFTCSPTTPNTGTRLTCMRQKFSLPTKYICVWVTFMIVTKKERCFCFQKKCKAYEWHISTKQWQHRKCTLLYGSTIPKEIEKKDHEKQHKSFKS